MLIAPRPNPRTMLTRRDDLAELAWLEALHDGAQPPPAGALPDGSVLVKVEAVALTANTLTYGLLGEQLGYWNFFPTAEPGWGALPAWGTGLVQDSATPEVPPGSRLFGLLPIATHCLLNPVQVTASSLRDGSTHRRGLPPAYHHYDRLFPTAPGSQAPDEDEALTALLRPLFLLGFLLAGRLLDLAESSDISTVVLTSASSKTAQAVAQQLDGSGLRLVGLTSPGHVASCVATGSFASVLAYPEAAGLAEHAGDGGLILVDVAGDAALRETLRAALLGVGVTTILVGAAHRAPGNPLVAAPGEEVFSAVDQLRRLTHELGPEELRIWQERAWQHYLAASRDRVRLLRVHGPNRIELAYRDVLDGRCPPEQGHLLSLHPSVS